MRRGKASADYADFTDVRVEQGSREKRTTGT